MAISTLAVVQTHALWPQRDARDPLGVWGTRLGVTGDASGGSIAVVSQVTALQKASFVYTCYSANISILTQATSANQIARLRLLTNWPNVDAQAGIQAYASNRYTDIVGSTAFTDPVRGIRDEMLGPAERFVLLFDPRPIGIAMDIVQLEINVNILNDTYSFESYGYFWDRAVLSTPGGPRHPGSN